MVRVVAGAAFGLVVGGFGLQAYASAQGVLVRLDASTRSLTAPVEVHLVGGNGDVLVTLSDSGDGADVIAADGVWSGAAFPDGDRFEVSVVSGGTTWSAGEVTWTADAAARDIDLKLIDDTVTLQSGVGGNAGASKARKAGGEGKAGRGGKSGKSKSTRSGGSRRRESSESVGDDGLSMGDIVAFSGLGLGVIALLAAAAVWLRGRGAASGVALPRGLEVVPEAGVFGEGTPSLTDGLFVWKVDEADTHAAVTDALRSLAAWHRVLVVAPKGFAVPTVPGGPVLVSHATRPAAIGDQLDALVSTPGRPPALLAVGLGTDPDRMRDLADAIPLDLGGIALVHGDVPTELPVVHGQKQANGWSLTLGSRTMVVASTPTGLVLVQEG